MNRRCENPPLRRLNTRARTMAAAIVACYAMSPAWAQLPVPVNATDRMFRWDGNQLIVTTGGDRVIIPWHSFSIGPGNRVDINQPSAASAVLNRVSGPDPSLIYGTLSSNGRVWLINPNGIMIGPGGMINTAGFIASTLDVSNANFLAGKLTFAKGDVARDVVNQGTITSPSGGSVYLIGANVTNEGLITTPQGETLLAAGQTVNLIDTGTPGVKVEITGAAGDTTNLGKVLAEAGRIGMAGVIVKNSGILNASGGGIDPDTGKTDPMKVVAAGGRIFLKASRDTYVDGDGRIVAIGTRGGRVEVLGNRVAVRGKAEIDASGAYGGGTILVGGDYQGKNPDIQNAQVTYFGPNAKLTADALNRGDGGKVIVWADNTTRAYGAISARGGALGGNGGFVETSGHRYLDFDARVDTTAPMGEAGTLLLDPTDFQIISYGGMYYSSSGTGTDADPFTDYGMMSGASIGWNILQSQLANGNVVISTQSPYGGSGNITVMNSPYGSSLTIPRSYVDSNGITHTFYSSYNSPTYDSPYSLSLLAEGSITVNAPFGNSGTGAIVMVAGWDTASTTSPQSTRAAGKDINLNAMVATNGPVTLKANAVKVNSGSANAGIDMTNGTLNVIANTLAITGYSGNIARISSAGNQYFTLGSAGTAGSLILQGSNSGYGGAAVIEQFGASAGQQFNILGGGSVTVHAGYGSSVMSGFCYDGPCSGNDARIENRGSGTQEFNFVNGGYLSLYGGEAGVGNAAGIQSDGAQLIWSSGQAPVDLLLVGGTGGAAGSTNTFDNGARIESRTSQTINAAGGSLLMLGGGDANTFGGAFLGGPIQKLSFGAAMLIGGSSNARDMDGFGAPVAIGNKNGANVTLDVGALVLAGGTGTTSPVGIGSLYGSATVNINASGLIAVDSGASGVGLGSLAQAAASPGSGGVYLAYGTKLAAPVVLAEAMGSVAIYGGITATGGTITGSEAGTPVSVSGINLYAGLGGSGNIYLGPQSSLNGSPINMAAYGGTIIDDRPALPSPASSPSLPSPASSQTTNSVLTSILASTTPPTTAPPLLSPLPPPTTGANSPALGGSVGGGENEFGSTSGSGAASSASNGDKDKKPEGAGNGKDEKPAGKKPVGRCNA